MRIAVIGAGISGLGAAYLLSRAHDVDVFERADYAGGHTHTVSHRGLSLDTGFLVHNDPNYPLLRRLFAELGAATQESDMSFSVACRACGLEYSGRRPHAQRRNLVRPRFHALLAEIGRWLRTARRSLDEADYESHTLGRYLSERRYSERFRDHFIVPLTSALWSTAPGRAVEFPAAYAIRFSTTTACSASGASAGEPSSAAAERTSTGSPSGSTRRRSLQRLAGLLPGLRRALGLPRRGRVACLALPVRTPVTRSEETIWIAAPAEAVFTTLADPDTHPVWRPSVVEFQADSEPLSVGTRITETVRFLGRRYTTIFEVSEIERPRVLSLRSIEGPLATVFRCELTPDGKAATGLRVVLDLESPRPLGLPVPGFHALMRWYLRDEGRRLARLVEQS